MSLSFDYDHQVQPTKTKVSKIRSLRLRPVFSSMVSAYTPNSVLYSHYRYCLVETKIQLKSNKKTTAPKPSTIELQKL